jgi:hypothetical protein
VSAYKGTIVLSLVGEGQGALSGCEQRRGGGLVTFSGCAISAAGRYRLRVSDKALGLSAESEWFTVADRVAKLVFAVSPSDGTVGVFGDQPVIHVLDGEGKLVDGYHGTLALSVGGEGQTSLHDCREDSNEGGVVKFAGCRLDTPGSYRLHVTDEALTLGGESEQFTLSR